MLTFDEPSHTYRWGGDLVPNVTRALALVTDLSRVDPDRLEIARQEGVAMHAMVDLLHKGTLDEDNLPDWLRPRLAGYRKFAADTGFRCFASEHRMYHPTYRYAGTCDMVGELHLPQGHRKLIDVVAMIDLKRSFAGGRVIGFQLAAYAELWNLWVERPLRIKKRFALKLHDDGTYAIEPFDDPQDFSHFLTILNFQRLKETL